MTQVLQRYSDWKAPSEDGQKLIWPEPGVIAQQAVQNAKLLGGADEVRVQGVSLPELRTAQRTWIGHKQDGQPIFGTGHQTELHHPGVWVKNALINALAEKAGGAGYHFSIETDAPKHLHLRWPGGSQAITDDPHLNDAAWTGLLDGPSPLHVDESLGALEGAAEKWSARPMAIEFLASLKRLSLESSNLAWQLTNALHQLDWELGMRHHAMLAGPMWMSPAYLVLVHEILARPEKFAGIYNGALGEFRLEQGIRSVGRPWPDLRVEGDTCEVPFWIDSPAAGTRRRGIVARGTDGWTITAGGGEVFCFRAGAEGWGAADELMKFLRRNDLVISPRALTLTLFFRLFIVDQFVHGIGGGRYDQVTDRVIEGYFGMEAPAFSVTTATMYFPDAVNRQRINLRPVLLEGRRLRHGLLSDEKTRIVKQIQLLPRHSRERQRLFYDMHSKLTAGLAQPMFTEWESRLEQTRKMVAAQAPLFDREMFFAMQPAERLNDMLHRYQKAVG